jgi:type IV secretion system protein VirD4
MIFMFFTLVLGLGLWLLVIVDPQKSQKPPKKLLTRNGHGFVFGEYKRPFQGMQYFYKPENTDGHILITGGTGRGKTSSILLPSYLRLKCSKFIVDTQKAEIALATAHLPGKRKIFRPIDPDACGFDPFYRLRGSDNPAQAAREIAMALIPEPVNVKDPFWVRATQNLLAGFILFYYRRGLNFVEIAKQILLNPLDKHILYAYQQGDDLVKYFMSKFIGEKVDAPLAGIGMEFSNSLLLFATDTQVQAALTKENNISPQDLEDGCDIFFCLEEELVPQWQPLAMLVIGLFIQDFKRRPNKTARRVAFWLEKFAELGKIEPVAKGLNTLRSKNITIVLVIQSLGQLDLLYGPIQREIMLDNCDYKAILSTAAPKTQEEFSKLVGTKEVIQTSKSTSYAPDNSEERGHTVNQSTTEQRTIKPHEFATLQDVVLLTPYGNYRAAKIRPVDR